MRFLLLAGLLASLALHADAQQPIPPSKGKPEPKAKSDEELLHGSWYIVGLEMGGNLEPERNYRGNSFTFEKTKGVGTATLREGRLPEIDFSYKLDPAANPKSIDLTLPTKDVKFRGIYKLDGDDLTICFSTGGPRPTQFGTRAGGDTETFTLKRNRWTRHGDIDNGVSVEMPEKPEELHRDLNTPAGVSNATLLVSRGKKEQLTFVFATARLPAKAVPRDRDVESALPALRHLATTAAFPKVRVRIDEKKGGPKFDGLGFQSLSFLVDSAEGPEQTFVRVKQLITGDRLVVLIVAGPEDAMKPDDLAHYWSSFRQPAEKKGKN